MYILATGAYGRSATATDWVNGKDFRIADGGPYFSIRDVETMKADSIDEIHFISRGGFIAFIVHVNRPTVCYK